MDDARLARIAGTKGQRVFRELKVPYAGQPEEKSKKKRVMVGSASVRMLGNTRRDETRRDGDSLGAASENGIDHVLVGKGCGLIQ